MAGAYASFRPSEAFASGAGVVALAGTFVSRLALTGCPATVTCQPEDPQWDAESFVQAFPIFAPSGTLGVQFAPAPWLRIGVSGQLPFWVDAPAKLQVRLPAHPFYTNDPPTRVEGSDASLRFMLAPIVRAGVEVRPTPRDRVEAAFVWEGWDVHDAILLNPTGSGIRLRNVRGVGTYEIGPQVIARGWQSAVSARLGYEREQALPGRWTLTPRAGVSVDTSATPEAYTSVLTLDALKVIAAVGVGLGRDRWRFHGSFAHAYSPPVILDPAGAGIPHGSAVPRSPPAVPSSHRQPARD